MCCPFAFAQEESETLYVMEYREIFLNRNVWEISNKPFLITNCWGDRYSDEKFLKIIGDKEKEKEMNNVKMFNRIGLWSGIGLMAVGSIMAMTSYNPDYWKTKEGGKAMQDTMLNGIKITIIGLGVTIFLGVPPKHYFSFDYAKNKAKEYNERLK
jgi:hypothetical protein